MKQQISSDLEFPSGQGDLYSVAEKRRFSALGYTP